MRVSTVPSGNDCYIAIEHGPVETASRSIEDGDVPLLCKRLPEGIAGEIQFIPEPYFFLVLELWDP